MTLYRTYRPQHFSELIGQPVASTTLQQALRQNRIAHAYLFSGSRGTGKTSTARIFARAISCLEPVVGKKSPTYEACDACAACRSVLENRCPDILEIDAASNRGIEDIRELREQTLYPPLQLKKKVYIIDEVHMLTGEAFNALLKTLEEPPEHCLFILATTELHKVPLTIRSRCQLIRFERGSVDSIQQKLDKVVSAEGLAVETGVTALLAEHAEGGFRDAETFLENLSTQHERLTLELAQNSLGILQQEIVDRLLETALSGDAAATASLLEQHVSSQPHSIERLLTQIINRLRQIVFVQQTGSGTNQAFLKDAAGRFPLSRLTAALDRFLEAYILQKGAPIASLSLEIACLEIAGSSGPVRSPHPVDAVGVEAEPPSPAKEESKPSAPAIAAQAPAVALTPVVLPRQSVPVIELRQEAVKDVRKAWKLMIDKIAGENLVLSQAIKQTVVHTVEPGMITVHVRYKFHADKMNEKKNAARISAIIQELTGSEWRIEYVVTSSVPRQAPRKEITTGVDDVKAVFNPNQNE